MSTLTRVAARHWDSADWDTANCRLCPHLCAVAPSRSGACGVRTNRSGTLHCDLYGKVSRCERLPAAELPLFHFAPGGQWLRLGLKGCNMRCPFCDTAQLSQIGGTRTTPMTPDDIVARAREEKVCGVGFGVTEPAVGHEFVVDVFAAVRAANLPTHLETNGVWSNDPFREALAHTKAVTFGLKTFDEAFWTKTCGGHLDVAMLNVETALAMKCHVEIVFLLVEQLASWREDLARFAAWISRLEPTVPIILRRLEPHFSWKDRETSRAAVREAHEILSKSMRFVYVLDPESGLMDTHCSKCRRVLIRRGLAGTIVSTGADHGCPHCGTPVPYID